MTGPPGSDPLGERVREPREGGLEGGYSTLIASVLFDLATLEIIGEPMPAKVRAWVAELATATA
ncbi:MAG: hypothetical protein ABJA81_08315 [Nocardioidaceae bacterium]